MILKTRAKFPGIIICLVALLLVSCMGGYGPPYDNSSFVSADTALDGRIGIFTMKRLVYRPASGWRAFPDGGIPKYLMDRNYIAVYDFTSGRTRVIYREDALREGFWLPGSSTLHIGPFVHYYGVKDDEIHYWTPDNRYLAFHLKTKTRREANRSGYGGVHSDPKAGLDLKRHLSILYRDRYYLSLGHRENGSWQYEQLPLTVREVAGE